MVSGYVIDGGNAGDVYVVAVVSLEDTSIQNQDMVIPMSSSGYFM